MELLAVVWGLEQFRLYIYEKPIKLLTDHQALEPLIKHNRSNKTYSARQTTWLERLDHFSINVSHIARKHLALTDYLKRIEDNCPNDRKRKTHTTQNTLSTASNRITNSWQNTVALETI